MHAGLSWREAAGKRRVVFPWSGLVWLGLVWSVPAWCVTTSVASLRKWTDMTDSAPHSSGYDLHWTHVHTNCFIWITQCTVQGYTYTDTHSFRISVCCVATEYTSQTITPLSSLLFLLFDVAHSLLRTQFSMLVKLVLRHHDGVTIVLLSSSCSSRRCGICWPGCPPTPGGPAGYDLMVIWSPTATATILLLLLLLFSHFSLCPSHPLSYLPLLDQNSHDDVISMSQQVAAAVCSWVGVLRSSQAGKLFRVTAAESITSVFRCRADRPAPAHLDFAKP